MATRGEKTRRGLLDAAIELFVEKGIDRTTTAEITQKAGVAEGTLFVHYKNKNALINAVYLDIKEREIKALIDVAFDPADAEMSIRSFTRAVCAYFAQNYTNFQVLEVINAGTYIDDETKEKMDQLFASYCTIMQQWQASGQLRAVDLTVLGDITWSMVGALIRYMHDQQITELPEDLVDIVWDAMRNHTE